ncbi:hypothetical protein D1164_01250 [Mariniphaga sediminis]|uniref:Endo-polygalacturonase n=1 Tax=Mariniphaga sediminis TaxID=1628158 RepID=A0A399D7K8_9BACT|nr:glycosyl hydrolase family 28 protein [Mariniphaga sediminis]RIH67088.1 hypothetical protein D1164_01250 [Mariniphaga sediminis]
MEINQANSFDMFFYVKSFYLFIVLILILAGCENVIIYSAPQSEAKVDTYELFVDRKHVDVYKCRVSKYPINQWWKGYQRSLDQTEPAGFAYWDMEGNVEVEIISKEKVKAAIIRPQSLGIEIRINNNKISFALDSIIPVVVEINGCHNALHLFPNRKSKGQPTPTSPNMYYFGPGVHDIGRLQLQSNDTVCIAGGAVVYGYITAVNASNILVYGKGILDGSRIPRSNLPYIGPGCMTLFGCRNISIKGIIMRDPNRWCLNLFGCQNATISNVKLIGLWRYNTDGLNVSNSQNISVKNCFVRSFDDALEVKGVKAWSSMPVENVQFRNCVIWCDWGRSIGITSETKAPYIKDVKFENCDIIKSTHNAIAVNRMDNASISNITFSNINIELDEWMKPKLQELKDDKYNPNIDDNYSPTLLSILVSKNHLNNEVYIKDNTGGIDSVLLENIKVLGNCSAKSQMTGLSSTQSVNNVQIRNLQFNDEIVSCLEQANITIGPFVEGVKLEYRGNPSK